ncbi:predicted protein [Nematostella vectensis]|uniref:MACPF domain-containing protein n=2 Tax=Nematostella vectensis TaxID=45351 RepID=A7RF42_NEMVE|nr:predicted protein [Nematostella vectensis]|eukprot:XP_001641957.1 predicted protein [Nematostella vectensis]
MEITSSTEGTEKENAEKEDPAPYTYVNGYIGPAIMNGCYGKNYQPGDPCYTATETTTQCRTMIDGAAFIGVGFDGRGEYRSESRKMSIIQRSCGGHSYYDGDQVPDTMNVHGIYDTSANMYTFSSRSEYQSYLEKEAGVSGSYFGFYAGVKKAWGNSFSSNVQSFLSIFDIDVVRYEIFKDEVKPADLSQAFLQEFMNLPPSYFHPGAGQAYQEFILRWGTHYIKSAKFGGELEFRKTLQGMSIATKEQASEVVEAEYKGLFASAGAKYESKSGQESKSENKFSSSSVVVQGGSQEIAAILSDEYSPTFKEEFKSWLNSIQQYPKAFKFHMAPITDLVNFRAGDLFPEEDTVGCDVNGNSLEIDDNNQPFYMKEGKKVTCPFKSRSDLDSQIKRRRKSLTRAIDIYFREGVRTSANSLGPGAPGCEMGDEGLTGTFAHPKWDALIADDAIALVEFDMREPLTIGSTFIPHDMTRRIKYRNNKWYTAGPSGRFVLYNGFPVSASDTSNKIINILGVKFTYDELKGTLKLKGSYFTDSSQALEKILPLQDKPLATVRFQGSRKVPGKKRSASPVGVEATVSWPCNVDWLNENMFERTTEGKCIHFTAASAGPIYVVFSVIPDNKETWYHVRIGPKQVSIYKNGQSKASTVVKNALGLGDSELFQSYFVCLKGSEQSTVIEYGKSQGAQEKGDAYLSLVDTDTPLHVQYYAFGNGEKMMQVANIHVVEGRSRLQAKCKGVTHPVKGIESPYCVPNQCHELCDPLMGCTQENSATHCGRCRYAKAANKECKRECPKGQLAIGVTLDCKVALDWIQLTRQDEAVCFAAKGDVPAIVQPIIDGHLSEVKLTYTEGGVSCSNSVSQKSHWGCWALINLNVIITMNNDETPVFPGKDFTYIQASGGDPGRPAGYWYTSQGYNMNSPNLVLKANTHVNLDRDTTLKIWYGEDLSNKTEDDNHGKTCFKIYGKFETQ